MFKHARSKFTSYSKSIKQPTSSDRLVRYPLLPFGLSSPVASQHALGLRGGVAFAAYLSHGCSFSPSEYSFGGDPVRVHSSFIRRGPRESPLLAKCGTDDTPLQDFISRTHITKRMTALTEYPARAEEFGTRAQVLPLLRCTLALGTQIVAALRLRFRLRMRTVVLKCTRTECT